MFAGTAMYQISRSWPSASSMERAKSRCGPILSQLFPHLQMTELVWALISFMISSQTQCRYSGPLSGTRDITWNFEKFLVNQHGRPVKRYSLKFENADIAADIDALLMDRRLSK